MPTTSVRLPHDLIQGLDALAGRAHQDRSTVLRQAIDRGLHALLMDEAIRAYETATMTAWSAAERAEVNLWEFLDELRRRGSGLRTDEAHLWRELEAEG